jgi:hypothetical protein
MSSTPDYEKFNATREIPIDYDKYTSLLDIITNLHNNPEKCLNDADYYQLKEFKEYMKNYSTKFAVQCYMYDTARNLFKKSIFKSLSDVSYPDLLLMNDLCSIEMGVVRLMIAIEVLHKHPYNENIMSIIPETMYKAMEEVATISLWSYGRAEMDDMLTPEQIPVFKYLKKISKNDPKCTTFRP